LSDVRCPSHYTPARVVAGYTPGALGRSQHKLVLITICLSPPIQAQLLGSSAGNSLRMLQESCESVERECARGPRGKSTFHVRHTGANAKRTRVPRQQHGCVGCGKRRRAPVRQVAQLKPVVVTRDTSPISHRSKLSLRTDRRSWRTFSQLCSFLESVD
jgi:hypothetical protein